MPRRAHVTPAPPRRAAPSEIEETCAFLAHAVARAAAVRARDGLPVPAMALAVARVCADQARGGQIGQAFAFGEGMGDLGLVDALLLTDRDAAALLRLSARTVRGLIASGRLRAVKIGGATRIRRSDLDAFISGQPATPRFLDQVDVKADGTGGAA